MSTIGLICAMGLEVPRRVSAARRQAGGGPITVGQRELELVVSGVGRKRAGAAAERLCSGARPPVLLLSLGACVAAQPYRVGQLVLARSVRCQGRELWLDGVELDRMRETLNAAELSYREGAFQTFDQVVTSRRDVEPGVVAGDMESFAIAEVAQQHRIPLVVVRAVSDVALAEAPRWYQYPILFGRFMRGLLEAKRSLNRFFETCVGG
jgi:nucleoside phosphorylase